MPRGTPSSLPLHALGAAVIVLLLAGAQDAWAQGPEVPRQLPPVASIPLRADSFDVRAFDPLGMPAAKPSAVVALEPRPVGARARHQEAGLATQAAPAPQEHMARSVGNRLFSDGWSRNGFGSLR